MRTTTGNRWIWLFAGALPALSLGAGCGDDTSATGATSGGGGFGGFGGGDPQGPASTASTGAPTSSSSGQQSSSQSSSASNSAQGTGGEGGGGDTGAGGPGNGGGGNGGETGEGGGGAPPGDCASDDDCDDLDTECRDYSCNLATSECTDFANINEDGLVGTDEDDDCSDLRCVAGVATQVPDDAETPTQDANVCTVETCDGGEVVSDPENDGDACGNEGGECLDGVCVECSDRSDCPDDTECRTWACSNANECVPTDEPPGTLIESGPLNDCVSIQCDDDAEATSQPDDSETPDDDTNECTETGICQDGEAFFPNEPDGTECTDGGVECTVGVCGAAVLLRQNFDALPTAGTPTLADFVTALDQGWVLANTNSAARVGAGSATAGGIYNFGADGSTERALGGVASGSTLTNAWGVCFTNDTGAATAGVTVTYDGEQWRDGGNDPGVAQSLAFSFSTFVTTATLGANIGTASTGDRATGWEDVAALGFASPVFESMTTGAAVDGNDDGRVGVSAAIPGLTLAVGASACVRWLDPNNTGNDHGLAIDNLVISGQ